MITLKKYKTERLFFTVNHPTQALYKELITRLLKRLGIDKGENGVDIAPHDGKGIPIYPSVEKKMKFKQGKIHLNSVLYDEGEGYSKREWFEKYLSIYY